MEHCRRYLREIDEYLKEKATLRRRTQGSFRIKKQFERDLKEVEV